MERASSKPRGNLQVNHVGELGHVSVWGWATMR